jgi:hypothetical protein
MLASPGQGTAAAAAASPTSLPAVALTFHPAQKPDHIRGWEKMCRLLADAGKLNLPGLQIVRTVSCYL